MDEQYPEQPSEYGDGPVKSENGMNYDGEAFPGEKEYGENNKSFGAPPEESGDYHGFENNTSSEFGPFAPPPPPEEEVAE